MIAARTWRGEPTTAEALLRRYNLRIEPAPDSAAWRIASIEETHGRAELRVICRGATLPVTIDWRTSAGLSIPVHTDAAGAVNLTVNADSYYVPERGPGPHRVQPAGAADAIVGWGLALGLPDAPPAEIDNRYLTVIVTWEYGVRVGGSGEPEGEHCAASERGTTPVSGVVTTVRRAWLNNRQDAALPPDPGDRDRTSPARCGGCRTAQRRWRLRQRP